MKGLFFALALAGCVAETGGGGGVVATTGMVADLARVIGGDRVQVAALMGPGVDPHVYKPTAGDLERIAAADLVLYNGRQLEGKMGDVLIKEAHRRPVVAVTEAIPDEKLLEPPELEGHYDPHVWFDVALWADTTRVVADALSRIDPAGEKGYRRRAEQYRSELLALHAWVKEQIGSIPESQRVLVTSHDAFRYFGRAYGMEVVGLQGISTATEAGVRDVQRVVELVVSRGVKAIFVESSVSPKAIEKVLHDARARGHEVVIGGTLYSDAMGDTPPEDAYVGMVRANVTKIVEALR